LLLVVAVGSCSDCRVPFAKLVPDGRAIFLTTYGDPDSAQFR
jgi:hypothetical protein